MYDDGGVAVLSQDRPGNTRVCLLMDVQCACGRGVDARRNM